jgi:ATP-binding protein involved in chromosome partitioning
MRPFKSSPPLRVQDIMDALQKIIDPHSGQNIVSLDWISGLNIDQNNLTISISIPPEKAPDYEPLRQEIEYQIKTLPNVHKVMVVLTAHKSTPQKNMKANPTFRGKYELPTVKHIIAVSSCKGGVGKSTTAVNLACTFHQQGLKVGIVDADVYGPSLPRMMNLKGRPIIDENKKITPHLQYGIQCASIGLFVNEDEPLIWRGLMVQTTIQQLFKDVRWQDLDVLVVDLPPGTGDAQLTMIQKVPLSGAIIVTTPQDIALAEARKTISMFKRLEIPVLGIIENMSVFQCPHCGETSPLFHPGNTQKEAEHKEIPFLGQIPFVYELSHACDTGEPFVFKYPEHTITIGFQNIVHQILPFLN